MKARQGRGRKATFLRESTPQTTIGRHDRPLGGRRVFPTKG
nr:MAG TPA: hypothetical protein [Caudoviricetes sp.]